MSSQTIPYIHTIQQAEEFYEECEDKSNRLELRIKAIQRDIDQCCIISLEIMHKLERQRTVEMLRWWRDRQFEIEEWLIDHEAKGWVST